MRRYAVVFEKAAANWAAYAPDLPGCITTGATPEEAKRNMREAMALHLEAMREVGEPMPRLRPMSISCNSKPRRPSERLAGLMQIQQVTREKRSLGSTAFRVAVV